MTAVSAAGQRMLDMPVMLRGSVQPRTEEPATYLRHLNISAHLCCTRGQPSTGAMLVSEQSSRHEIGSLRTGVTFSLCGGGRVDDQLYHVEATRTVTHPRQRTIASRADIYRQIDGFTQRHSTPDVSLMIHPLTERMQGLRLWRSTSRSVELDHELNLTMQIFKSVAVIFEMLSAHNRCNPKRLQRCISHASQASPVCSIWRDCQAAHL